MPGGRPRIKIDWEAVERMAGIYCTQDEIAHCTGISVDTLDRRCKETHGVSFAEFCEQKRGFGRMSLRRAMWQRATVDKDNTMLIWLSKNHLGMADKVETKQSVTIAEKVYVAEWGGTQEQVDTPRNPDETDT